MIIPYIIKDLFYYSSCAMEQRRKLQKDMIQPVGEKKQARYVPTLKIA